MLIPQSEMNPCVSLSCLFLTTLQSNNVVIMSPSESIL